ncbi:MAG TPA: dTMP kinase [Nevskiaceae bacterium]
MTRERGRFFVVEGGEGTGKSTHCAALADWLRSAGRTVTMTREPGGSPLAEALRDVFLRDWPEGVGPKTETLVVFAARDAHLRTTIVPALRAGHDVVCDRFIDSSYAYQGAGRGMPANVMQTLEHWVLDGLQPDLTFVLDLPPGEGLRRTRHRGNENRFEHEQLEFLQRVRRAYLRRAERFPARYVVIDAARSIQDVQDAMRGAITRRWAQCE